MSVIRVCAPVAGWAAALEAVPDPVFAERMMGDGCALDPLGELLCAPCDGEVIAIAPTAHSVTLRLANGAELLIHIGIDTVALAGEGFAALVAAGARVRTGEPLIRFDLDAIAGRVESLLTPIVVANEGYSVTLLGVGRRVAAGEPLMEVSGARAGLASDVGGEVIEREAVVALGHGIHARPAGRIAAALKPFAAEVRVSAHGREANARSVVALMTLGVKLGQRVTIAATGADAAAAAAAVAALIQTADPAEPAAQPARSDRLNGGDGGPLFRGVCASPGLAAGPIAQFRPSDPVVPEHGGGAAHEAAALASALAALRAEPAAAAAGQAAEIAAAHRALLDDPELLDAAQRAVAVGKSAAFAWRAATRDYADAIRATGDPLLIERVDDLVDVERRVIAALLGGGGEPLPELPQGAILVAETLLPSQFLALDLARLGGIVTAGGGPTSHVAILAAAAGAPMLVAAGDGVLAATDGGMAILDAGAATLDSDPDAAAVERCSARLEVARARRVAHAEAARAPCVMADGTRIEIFANLAAPGEAGPAVMLGAEGCGLLRTEFLFVDRAEPPSEDEQRAVYAAIAAALEGRLLIVRTLDIGGDKPVAYLPFASEDNPALGQRGIRLSLARPELLTSQLRAILAGVPREQCRIMVPMITDRDELRRVRAALNAAAAAVGAASDVPLGVMIETPAAAMLAESLAAEADFFSIGTNDLSQYALAADRGNAAVAGMIDALHPAVLRLIAQAAQGAAAHGRELGVCGGLASDPRASAVLIGLGATELSASPAAIPALKAAVRGLTLAGCRALAQRALAAATATEVRALLEEDPRCA